MAALKLSSRVVDLEDSAEEVFEDYYAKGWTDGLPIIPPTPSRVERMIAAGGRPPEEIVASIPPREAPATVEKLAINAVMAGCHPSYFPVILAIAECMPAPDFDLLGMNTTTNAVWLTTIINGPVRQKIDLNCSYGVLGPGFRANATIGRTVRLVQLNIGGAKPGEVTKSTQGHPGRYSSCIGEYEEKNPWQPLHVEHGFAREDSTVTLLGTTQAILITETDCKTAEGLLHFIANSMTGVNVAHGGGGRSVLQLCPDHAMICSREGLSKQDVKKVLCEKTSNIPMSKWPQELTTGDLKRLRVVGHRPHFVDGYSKVHDTPEQFEIVVAGGLGGYHSAWFTFWGQMQMKKIGAA